MFIFRSFVCVSFSLLLAACGNPYEEGKAALAKLDYDTALAKFKKAASSGNTDAIMQVAEMYKLGQGGGVNEEEAVRWYRLAADKGNSDAMFNLGEMYRTGYMGVRGLTRSDEEAIRWYVLGADKGSGKAALLAAHHLIAKSRIDDRKYLEYMKLALLQSVSVEGWPDPISSIGSYYYSKGDFVSTYKWRMIFRTANQDPKRNGYWDYQIDEIEALPDYSEKKCLDIELSVRKLVPNLGAIKCAKQESVTITRTDLMRAKEEARLCVENKFKGCS
jgi:hypothetical protein